MALELKTENRLNRMTLRATKRRKNGRAALLTIL